MHSEQSYVPLFIRSRWLQPGRPWHPWHPWHPWRPFQPLMPPQRCLYARLLSRSRTRADWLPNRQGARRRSLKLKSEMDQESIIVNTAARDPSYPQSPCIFDLAGPILFTAPHGVPLWRGGEDGRKRQKHLREFWATELTLKLARHASKTFGIPASFMIWDTKHTRPYDSRNLDPNYLSRHQFEYSPWHQALEAFCNYGEETGVPLFHVDLHGKKDRRSDLALDLGFGGMKAFYHDKKLVNPMRKDLEDNLNNIFKPIGIVKNNLSFSVDADPRMCGFWQDTSVLTMSSQSAMLGIPSVQLEIPKSMRQRLHEDDDFLASFGDCILHVYDHVICEGNAGTSDWYRSRCRGSCVDIDAILLDEKQLLRTKREPKI